MVGERDLSRREGGVSRRIVAMEIRLNDNESVLDERVERVESRQVYFQLAL